MTLPNTVFPFLWHFLKEEKRKCLFLCFSALFNAINFVLRPFIVKKILDNIAHSQEAFSSRSFLFVLAYIGICLLDSGHYLFYESISLRFYPYLRGKVIRTLTQYTSHHSYLYFQDKFAGSLATKIKDAGKSFVEVLRFLIDTLLTGGLSLIFASFALFSLHSSLLFILWGWAILFSVFSISKMPISRRLAHQFTHATSQVIGHVVDFFSNILNIHLFHSYRQEEKKLKQLVKETTAREILWKGYLLKITTWQNGITALMTGLCLLFLVWNKQRGMVSVGDFGFVLIITQTIAQLIRESAEKTHKASEYFGTMTQALDILAIAHRVIKKKNAPPIQISSGEILFHHVSFRYPKSAPLLLDHSITIRGGEKVGLVGYSGSGKTTFIHLIPRLYDIQEGHIAIDNQDIVQHSLSSLRHQISVIPQEPILFHRTIRENIAYGKVDATEKEIIDAAKKAQAHKFIMKLRQGYDSWVGERGIKLSGGQRQRLIIARAIIKNAPILLLDEATSALDSATEQDIQHSFFSLMKNRTTLVIAHRLSTLLRMDRILVFHKGKVIQDGKHDTLVNSDGLYAKLWSKQIEGLLK